MKFGEHTARKIVLAQAIEMADLQGKLLSEVEREEIDRRVNEAARAMAGANGVVDVPNAIFQRAELVLKAVGERNAYVASLQDKSPWWDLLVVGAPLAALVLGVAAHQVANPHKVDLLSAPFLIILIWNFAVYVGLLVSLPLSFLRQESDTFGTRLRVYLNKLINTMGRRRIPGLVRAEVTAQFNLRWQIVANSLGIQRITQVLHFAAAAWGMGVTISLLWNGVFAEYRAGWESTYLEAPGLHRILSFIFTPATFVFSEPFTLQDVERMHFSSVAPIAKEYGRRWAFLYSGLLLIVVVVPRLLLAAFSAWRVHVLSRQVSIDLNDAYFEKLIDRICPARVALGVLAQDSSVLAELERVLIQDEMGADNVLIRTAGGDSLQLVNMLSRSASIWNALPGQRSMSLASGAGATGRMGVLDDCDVVIQVVETIGQLEKSLPQLSGFRKPVLILVRCGANLEQSAVVAHGQLLKRHHDLIVDVLAIDAIGACWVQERKLFETLSICVPRSRVTGLGRLGEAWELRNQLRFSQSMSLLSLWLIELAREVESVRSPAKSLRLLFSPKLRADNRQAELVAEATLIGRLNQREEAATQALYRLHGINESEGKLLEKEVVGKFETMWNVDPPEAGVVGVASGAAVGASIDLMAVGMTMGVGLLIGSLVGGLLGGGAGYFGARLKNRTTLLSGNSMQLSDEMLPELVVLALMRYLSACHHGRICAARESEMKDLWRNELVGVVQKKTESLLKSWADSRRSNEVGQAKSTFAAEMETIALIVLRKLYPDELIRVSPLLAISSVPPTPSQR